MPPLPKQTFFNLPAAKREAILRAAIDEFADHDYRNASVSRIVARAGIAKGSLYQYFADKKDLYLYLLRWAGEEKLRFIAGLQPPDPGMGVFPYLRWLMTVGAHFRFAHPKLEQLTYRALYREQALRDEGIQQMREQSAAFYRHLVQTGQAQGDIDPRHDPELVTFAFTVLSTELGRQVLERLPIDPHHDFDREQFNQQYVATAMPLFSALVDMLEHGLRPRPAAAADGKEGA